jgi:hypothetical protein
MAFQFSQFPNGASPLNSRPLRSFVAHLEEIVIPPGPEPEVPTSRVRGSRGKSVPPPLEPLTRVEAIDADDLEVILASMAVVAGHLWRN